MAEAGYNEIVPQTCGVGVLGIFRGNGTYHPSYELGKITPCGGCGWVIVGYTNERPEYKEAYVQLKKRWPIVFESEKRTNSRTGNEFFFVIYDTKGKK